MKVLVACEFSGVVRDAFIARGHDAVSCDLMETEVPGPHIRGDVANHLDDGWDMMLSFPPCTYLAASGGRWFKDRSPALMERALAFVQELMDAPIPRVCVENPVGVITKRIRRPNQAIQPWQYGHPYTKTTHLWLRNLPNLRRTNVVEGRDSWVRAQTGSYPWRERGRTFPGIAEAMAEQWGVLAPLEQGVPTDAA